MNSRRTQAAMAIASSIGAVLVYGATGSLNAQTPPPAVTLFENVRIFDGMNGRLSGPSYVLVRGNKIERISSTPVPTDPRAETVLLDGGGRTLMPGLIDNHWHAMLIRPTPAAVLAADIGNTILQAGAEARDTLLRGSAFGLKRAIDEGLVTGPRIFPSGAMIWSTKRMRFTVLAAGAAAISVSRHVHAIGLHFESNDA